MCYLFIFLALKDEKPLQPTDKISSYILIKNAESNPEVLASIQQLTKKISDDSKVRQLIVNMCEC